MTTEAKETTIQLNSVMPLTIPESEKALITVADLPRMEARIKAMDFTDCLYRHHYLREGEYSPKTKGVKQGRLSKIHQIPKDWQDKVRKANIKLVLVPMTNVGTARKENGYSVPVFKQAKDDPTNHGQIVDPETKTPLYVVEVNVDDKKTIEQLIKECINLYAQVIAFVVNPKEPVYKTNKTGRVTGFKNSIIQYAPATVAGGLALGANTYPNYMLEPTPEVLATARKSDSLIPQPQGRTFKTANGNGKGSKGKKFALACSGDVGHTSTELAATISEPKWNELGIKVNRKLNGKTGFIPPLRCACGESMHRLEIDPNGEWVPDPLAKKTPRQNARK